MSESGKAMVAIWDNATDAILADHAKHHVNIPLSLFRSTYLPLLASQAPNKDMSPWFDYVKHPGIEVQVLDDATYKVVYVVPPIATSLATTVAHVGSHAMEGQMQTVMQHIERSPRQGARILDEMLTKRVVAGQTKQGIATNRIRLNHILVAEGYEPLVIPGTKSFTGMVAAPGKGLSPEESKGTYLDEYDDF